MNNFDSSFTSECLIHSSHGKLSLHKLAELLKDKMQPKSSLNEDLENDQIKEKLGELEYIINDQEVRF